MTATQHLMNANNTLNRKVDQLAETLADLTLGDDLKEYVSSQLAGIRQEGKTRDYKVKDLKTFDGKKQKLRSWLTAANLQLVNKGIEGEERKVRFIGGYLEGLPWDWFEAILRESDERPRTEWSKRTTRILGSYAEFKKALGQVFGEKNERQTAAEKLQRLRQTGTVTSYITEFQVITSSLDWDSEALEDKYLEGLKPEVRKALIYYPNEPENLEELFDRTQRIDKGLQEQKEFNNKGSYRYPGNGSHGFKRNHQTYHTDRDGDVRMKGAKVNMEKARKERLCFNCEKPGHQARNCRKPKTESTRELRPVAKIRMLRSRRDNDDKGKGPENSKGNNPTPTGITSVFEDLTLEDLATEPSTDETSSKTLSNDQETTIRKWRKEIETANRSNPRTQGYRGRNRPFGTRKNRQHTLTLPDSESDELPEKKPDESNRYDEDTSARQTTGTEMRNSMRPNEIVKNTGYQSWTEGSPRSIEQKLMKVNYEEMSKINRPAWVEYSRCYDPKRTADEENLCKCYGFNQECWANSEERWIPHIEHCEACLAWAKTNCAVQGHSSKSKNSMLSDMGNRRYLACHPIKDNKGISCCERRVCTHEFYVHDIINIPWWACVEEECDEHHNMKVRNQRWPKVPTSTLLKSQKCPCFRNGCLCNFSNAHPYRESLLIPPGNLRTVENLKDTRELWKDIKKESEKTLHQLNENIMRLRKVSTSTTEVKQIEIQVEAENETLAVIIDCGASVDYVNEAWCEKKGLKTVDIGKGWMEGYDGQLTNVQLKETEIELKFQGMVHRHTFRVIKQTGTDTMVLGMPWLQLINPDVNWKSRRVTLRKKKAKKSKKRNNQESTAQSKVVREVKEQTEEGRGGYNNVQEEERYQEQLVETREKLPKELRDYAEVFCHRR